MRTLRPWLAAAVLLIPTVAHADDHFADLFAGFARARASALLGFHEAYSLRVREFAPWSLVGDLGVFLGSHDGTGVTQVTFLGGARYSLPRIADRHLPFVQVLIGGVSTTTEGAQRETHFATAIGGGWEVALGRGDPSAGHLSTKWAVRAHADYILQNDASDLFRVSAGIVYRFRK